jgi:hypothetical protein
MSSSATKTWNFWKLAVAAEPSVEVAATVEAAVPADSAGADLV